MREREGARIRPDAHGPQASLQQKAASAEAARVDPHMATYFAASGIQQPGVDFEIAISSSFMSTATSPKSGVLR